MIQGLDHAALNVSDLPRAVVFYRDVLGMWSVDACDPATASYCWLNFGAGQTLNLALAPERTPKALGLETDLYTSAHLAFTAPEAFSKTLQEHLGANGVSFHRSSTGLYFSDPDGNFLEVTWWREKGLRDAGAEHW
jgi:catechol-2,3-dioxygenase